MDNRQRKMVDEISGRWHRDSVEGGLSQAIFDIGCLCGVIASLDEERKDLLSRLREAVAPE